MKLVTSVALKLLPRTIAVACLLDIGASLESQLRWGEDEWLSLAALMLQMFAAPTSLTVWHHQIYGVRGQSRSWLANPNCSESKVLRSTHPAGGTWMMVTAAAAAATTVNWYCKWEWDLREKEEMGVFWELNSKYAKKIMLLFFTHHKICYFSHSPFQELPKNFGKKKY